ncbi:MAG TPA: hypothetical protein VEF04_12065 [Blastocatellia bacterium]|nr:hypothetical protein [Blastocatellia bacterium]
MKRDFLKYAALIGCPVCFLLGLMTVPSYRIVSGVLWGKTVQTLNAPQTRHRAALLKKHNLGDINFVVKVDGERVYFSPDYMPFVDGAYRETLVWDKTGNVVVLELMGKRVFAYHAGEKRRLAKGELKQYDLFPTPADQNYASIVAVDE